MMREREGEHAACAKCGASWNLLSPLVCVMCNWPFNEPLPLVGGTTLKPLTIIVSAFPEGHFSRVEAVLRVDFDLCVAGKPSREKRARLEGAIERALRGLVVDLGMEEG